VFHYVPSSGNNIGICDLIGVTFPYRVLLRELCKHTKNTLVTHIKRCSTCLNLKHVHVTRINMSDTTDIGILLGFVRTSPFWKCTCVVLKFKTLSRKNNTHRIECYSAYVLGFVKRDIYNYFQERLHL
jgi:hypothetical protein